MDSGEPAELNPGAAVQNVEHTGRVFDEPADGLGSHAWNVPPLSPGSSGDQGHVLAGLPSALRAEG